MTMQHHALARAAIAATLTATILAPRPAFSQSKPGGPGSASSQVVTNGPEQDPNMPNLPYAYPGAPIIWSLSDETTQIRFLKPSSQGSYLGFNEKGSWIKNGDDGKFYVWNIKDRSLTLGADKESGVPLDLRNPSHYMTSIIIAKASGQGNTGTQVANNNKGRRTPYIPPSVAGDGNAQQGGEKRTDTSVPGTNAVNPVGASRTFRGTAATIKAGVLTFTLDDPASAENGKPVSLNVTRSAMNNPNTAKPNGIAGAWLGEDPKNKNVIFSLYVQGEGGAVSGSMMTGMAAEVLKRMMNANRQQ